MTFSGRVYDGPWEGKNYECERPYFVVPLTKLASALSWREFVPTEEITIQHGYYRWSQPIRAWVYCWDGNPSRYVYEAYREKVY